MGRGLRETYRGDPLSLPFYDSERESYPRARTKLKTGNLQTCGKNELDTNFEISIMCYTC